MEALPSNQQPDMNEWLERLRQGDRNAIEKVYRWAYPQCCNWIVRNSGTVEDARDLFQEALMVLVRKTRDPDFQLTAHVKTYLFSIMRNLWLKRLRQKGRNPVDLKIDDEGSHLQLVSEDEIEEKKELESKHEHIAAAIEETKEDCKKILIAFYFQRTPLKVIAEMMDYSASFAKVKKKRCMDALKKKVLARYEKAKHSDSPLSS